MKPGYKQTEVGVIPEEWEVKSLGNVASITTGRRDVNEGNPAGDYPFFTCSRTHTFSDHYSFDTEAILIAGNGDVGNLHYFKGRFEAYQRTYVVQKFEAPVRFVWHQLNYRLTDSLGLGKIGSSIPYIKKENLTGFGFPIPTDPAEQRAIAAALSEVDALLAALDRLLAKKRDLKQAAMQQLLTGQTRLPGFEGEWVVKRLGEIVQPRRERVDPRRTGGHEFCVELENLASASGVLLGSTTAGQFASLKTVFKESDVLFGKLRAYLRKYWCATRPGVCSTEIWALVASPELSDRFLFQLVQTNDFIDAASNAYGTHMPRSDWKVVRELEVSLPPLPEQTAIAAVLSDMDAELATLEQRREKTRALKQGMMQELLTGRTRLV